MNPNQTLEKILTDYEHTVLQNSRKVESLFKDLCYEPEYKREVYVLLLALKENIPSELINNQPVNDMLIMRLIKKLDDAYFIPAQQAQAAIETWAKALNIALPKVEPSNIAGKQVSTTFRTLAKNLNTIVPKINTENIPNLQVSDKIKTLKNNLNTISSKVNTSNIPTQQVSSKIKTLAKNLNTVLPKVSTSNTQQSTSHQLGNKLDPEIWTDPRTGLMWTRVNIGQHLTKGKCTGQAEKFNWLDAHQICENMNTAGYNDWRLPEISELMTIMLTNQGGFNCPPDSLFKPSDYHWGMYWSASKNNSAQTIYCIDFHFGKICEQGQMNKNYIRAVRGKLSPKLNSQSQASLTTPIQNTSKTKSSNNILKIIIFIIPHIIGYILASIFHN